MVLSDRNIRQRLFQDGPYGLEINPFVESSPPGVVSYGLTSGGYDLRLGNTFKVFTNARGAVVSPRGVPAEAFVELTADKCTIPPNSFCLGVSVETLRIPRDVICTCVGKSTYARLGIIVNVTPLEPEWRGQVTVEISNTTPCPAEVYANEGILQVLFHLLSSPCERSYADKKGRYQDQRGITLPFVR